MRYRVNVRPERDLHRTADRLFTRARVAVFVDDCHWHGCPEHFSMPATNLDYWEGEISRNRRRDVETTVLLEERGWTDLRFWEREAPTSAADSIVETVCSRRDLTR